MYQLMFNNRTPNISANSRAEALRIAVNCFDAGCADHIILFAKYGKRWQWFDYVAKDNIRTRRWKLKFFYGINTD